MESKWNIFLKFRYPALYATIKKIKRIKRKHNISAAEENNRKQWRAAETHLSWRHEGVQRDRLGIAYKQKTKQEKIGIERENNPGE